MRRALALLLAANGLNVANSYVNRNFMTAIAEVRVLPESLRTGYDKLKSVWPG